MRLSGSAGIARSSMLAVLVTSIPSCGFRLRMITLCPSNRLSMTVPPDPRHGFRHDFDVLKDASHSSANGEIVEFRRPASGAAQPSERLLILGPHFRFLASRNY